MKDAHSERSQVAVTVDPETVDLLKTLANQQRKKVAAYVRLLIFSASTERARPHVKDFYQRVNFSRSGSTERKLFNWEDETIRQIDELSYDVLEVGNRSLTLRVLVRFAAFQAKLIELN